MELQYFDLIYERSVINGAVKQMEIAVKYTA